MEPPKNTEVIETDLTTLWLDESGIVCSVSKKNVPLTIEAMKTVFDGIKKISNNKKNCFLNEMTYVAPPDKETREYATSEANKYIKALALITKSPLSRMIGNILFRLKLLFIPTKMFTNENEAKGWLKQYL